MPTPPNNGEYLTQLPTVSAAHASDIIYAVQGGLSVQETLSQVQSLFQANLVTYFSGNPNGSLAGTIYQFCWDTLDSILYLCTFAGTSSTTIWSKVITLTGGSGITITQNGNIIQISSSASGTTWNNITGTSAAMMTNNGYQTNNAGLVTLTLPISSSFGDLLEVSGFGAGGWTIVQLAGQQIIVGSALTTLGVGGSLSSTNRYDSIQFRCVVANLVWEAISGPQGCLTYV